jgi:hypothetical protein
VRCLGREQSRTDGGARTGEIATLGWFGRVTCVPELLEWLTSRDDDERRAGWPRSHILGLVIDETKTAEARTGNSWPCTTRGRR